MFKLLFIVILLTPFAFTKDDLVKGEGHFWAEEGDSINFVKKQLLYQSYKNIISKELKAMGLDQKAFWDKYEERFKEEKLELIKTSLDKKFGLYIEPNAKKTELEQKQLSKKERKKYDEQLREKTLVAQRQFGDLDRVIRSFSINKLSRSPQNPKSRFISISAKVDRVYLSKVYYNFMSEQKPKEVSRLYIYTDFELINTSWADLGVSIKSDFTGALDESWQKWFINNKVSHLNEVEILGTDGKKEFALHFNSPYEETIKNLSGIFKDSLVLRLNLKIEKVAHHDIFREYEFVFSGDIVLFDLLMNQAIYKEQLEKQSKTYRNINYDQLKNALANYVYRIPLGKFTEMKSSFSEASKVDSAKIVTVESFKNIDEIFDFISLLKNKGIRIKVNPVLHSFNSSKAEILLFYQGGAETLESFINSLEGYSKRQKFGFEFYPEQNYRIKLIHSAQERKKQVTRLDSERKSI